MIKLKKSTNLGNDIAEEYKKLKDTVQVSYKSDKDSIDVKLNSSCTESSMEGSTHTCKNNSIEIIDFEAQINVTSEFCKDENQDSNVEIDLFGSTEKLTLEIKCEKCQCGDTDTNSAKCSSHGDLICGGCQCQ